MRQQELRLTDEDRLLVDDVRSKGLHSVREVNRAHVLSALDKGLPEAQIMAVLGVGRKFVWSTREAYLQGGLTWALSDVARPGRPRQYDETRIKALASSTPPAGQRRWTIMALEKAAREEPGMDQVSRETLRRMLKKTDSNAVSD